MTREGSLHNARRPAAALAAAACLLAIAALPALAHEPTSEPESRPPVRVVLTHGEYALKSDPVLSCESRIHAYLTFEQPLIGEHRLEGSWIRPDGEVAAHARVPLAVPHPGRRTAHLWFEPGGGTGMLSGASKSLEYGGRWLLEVRMDGTTVLKTHFQMVCG